MPNLWIATALSARYRALSINWKRYKTVQPLIKKPNNCCYRHKINSSSYSQNKLRTYAQILSVGWALPTLLLLIGFKRYTSCLSLLKTNRGIQFYLCSSLFICGFQSKTRIFARGVFNLRNSADKGAIGLLQL